MKISKNGDGVYSGGNFLYAEVVNEPEVIDMIRNLRDRRCNDVTDLARNKTTTERRSIVI